MPAMSIQTKLFLLLSSLLDGPHDSRSRPKQTIEVQASLPTSECYAPR